MTWAVRLVFWMWAFSVLGFESDLNAGPRPEDAENLARIDQLISHPQTWTEETYTKVIPSLLSEVGHISRRKFWSAISKQAEWPASFWAMIPALPTMKVKKRAWGRYPEKFENTPEVDGEVYEALLNHNEKWPENLKLTLWKSILEPDRIVHYDSQLFRLKLIEENHDWPEEMDVLAVDIVRANRMPNVRGPIFRGFLARPKIPRSLLPELVLAARTGDPDVQAALRSILTKPGADIPIRVIREVLEESQKAREVGISLAREADASHRLCKSLVEAARKK